MYGRWTRPPLRVGVPTPKAVQTDIVKVSAALGLIYVKINPQATEWASWHPAKSFYRFRQFCIRVSGKKPSTVEYCSSGKADSFNLRDLAYFAAAVQAVQRPFQIFTAEEKSSISFRCEESQALPRRAKTKSLSGAFARSVCPFRQLGVLIPKLMAHFACAPSRKRTEAVELKALCVRKRIVSNGPFCIGSRVRFRSRSSSG